jgi:hypothetical protein
MSRGSVAWSACKQLCWNLAQKVGRMEAAKLKSLELCKITPSDTTDYIQERQQQRDRYKGCP